MGGATRPLFPRGVDGATLCRDFLLYRDCSRMEQRLRNEHLKMLKDGRLPIMVTTNAIARGIDVDRVNHVSSLNFEALEFRFTEHLANQPSD